jgi:hypothetical protein
MGQVEPEEEQAPAAQDPGLPGEGLPVQRGVGSYQLGNVTDPYQAAPQVLGPVGTQE